MKLPSILWHHASLGFIPALQGAPIADDQAEFPCVIVSHGLGSHPDVHAQVSLELASHGFVVVVPEHTDESACVATMPDGSLKYHVRLTPEQLADSAKEYARRTSQLAHRSKEICRVVETVAHLAKVGAPTHFPQLKGRVNVGSVGVLGHSFGAATALTATSECDGRAMPPSPPPLSICPSLSISLCLYTCVCVCVCLFSS